MRLSAYTIVRLSPPGDSFVFLQLATDGGITGWGEITGSGNDRAAVAFAEEAFSSLVGLDALDIDACMAIFNRFRVPRLRDRCATTAWSGINQALWDIAAQARGVPLYALLGENGGRREVPLYANLNRGLLRDRRPASFLRNTEDALAAGFAFAKVTPFDEVTPDVSEKSALTPALQRLEAVFAAVDSVRVAIDCHWRFNLALARAFMEWQEKAGRLYWLEDLLDFELPGPSVADFRSAFPCTRWAGGEDVIHPHAAETLIHGPTRPDVFMPDVKYLCGLDVLRDLLLRARARGCVLSLHNPSGPIATAVSAHLCQVVGAEEPLEFCFRAVDDRPSLTDPVEPVQGGTYYLGDAPGIGVAPSRKALEEYGTVLAKGSTA